MKARASIRPTHPRKVKNPQQPNEKKPEEKKTTNNSSAPKVVKSQTKRPDIFELQKPFVTSFSCVSDVVKAFSNGTEELRNLLSFECELIYECKICRGLFRSLANFLQHKRYHCPESARDLKRNLLNGEVTDKTIHINGSNPKGQLLATRKTMRKDVYDILRKVGNMAEEPLPEQFFTRDIQETDAALLSFFQQEGKAATEERGATVGPDGFVLDARPSDATRTVKSSKEIPLSEAASDVSRKQSNAKPSDVSSRPSDAENRRTSSTLNCSKCSEPFGSVSELTAHVKLQSCNKLRRCYECPICKKIVATPWSVYRHLRRVHCKTAEQVRKLRKSVEKKMVRADEMKLKSPPSPVRKPVLSEKTREVMRPLGDTNQVSVGVNCGSSQLSSTPSLFKRAHSPDVEVDNKNRIPEVRSSEKTHLSSPAKSESETTPVTSQQNLLFSILNSSQPRVVLSASLCASLNKQQPTSSPQCVPSPPGGSVVPQQNPPKKIKIEKDLSWLKRGPSVPIVGGPLTRTARALYGSPRKINPTESDKAEWNKSVGMISGVGSDVVKVKTESMEAEPAQDYSSENEVENPSGPEDASPSDGDDNDSYDPSETEDKKPKGEPSSINKRLSSSEDNVRSLTSSVDSFDATPSKEKKAAQELNDRMSTSGIETEVDRPTTSSTGPSDDDSGGGGNLVDTHSKDLKPSLTELEAYPSNHSPSDYLESTEDTHDETSLHNHPPEVASYSHVSAPSNEIKPTPHCRSRESRFLLPKFSPRETDETEHSCCDLAMPLATPKDMKPIFDSDDSNSAEEDEEEHDDQLRQNMMEVIFGTLSPTSFNVSCVRDCSSS